MTIKTGFTKRAWRRDDSVPAGVKAKGKINCPCGNAPWSDYADGKDVFCACGRIYDSEGWILKEAGNLVIEPMYA